MSKRTILWLLIAVLIGALSWYKIRVLDAGKHPGTSTASTGAIAARVRVEVVQVQDITNPISATGTLMPFEQTDLRVEATGRITYIGFKEGAFVKKGSLLLKLNDADLQAQLNKNRIEYKHAVAQKERQKQLFDAQAIGLESYENARNLVHTLDADAQLIKTQIAKTKLYAPFSGVIGTRLVAPGAFVQTGAVVAPLMQINPMKLEFTLPEQYGSRIKIGEEFEFTIDGQSKPFKGKVALIDPVIDADTRNLKVRALTKNIGNQLRSGAFAKVVLPLDLTDQILIPANAVVPSANARQVWLFKNGKSVAVNITLGLRTDDRVQVLSGLAPGDSLIVAGLLSVRANQAVEIIQ
jgi:membrane fusion protein, multidrug efflux system